MYLEQPLRAPVANPKAWFRGPWSYAAEMGNPWTIAYQAIDSASPLYSVNETHSLMNFWASGAEFVCSLAALEAKAEVVPSFQTLIEYLISPPL